MEEKCLVTFRDTSQDRFDSYLGHFKPAPDTYWLQMNGNCASVPDENIEMIHALNSYGARKGLVISLQDVWQPLELFPCFKACTLDWTCDNHLELSHNST